ncbi:MAG: dihydrolipoyl dehydrogenase [Woeseiaceae bacterium]|nr:dihydrolipoyl dehydrogenase [Woeseiaceae bacterium]
MQTRYVDVAVIGAGSAGLVAFRTARQHTDNVVLIEGGAYGTTCARVGCMPSKLLIAAAEAAHAAHAAPAFGIETGTVKVDGVAVMNRVRSERDRFVGFVVEGVNNIPEEQRIRGYARFLDDHRLQVGDDLTIVAKRIVIATGSTPAYPRSWDDLGDRLLVNDDIFDWQDLPSSIAVFGPGVIGLELGQALHRLGVDVHMFGLGGRIGPLTDPDVISSARKAMQAEFYLDDNADVSRMERVGDAVEIDFVDTDGKARSISVDYVVAATGRRPSVAGLGLENTRLPLDGRGVPLFDTETLRVGESHVFIAGDANNDRPLLHEATDEGRIAGSNAGRYPNVRPGERRTPLGVVFSDPQIAMVGSTFGALAGSDYVTGEVSFEDQGRSRVMLKNQGLLRVYADTTSGRFLGAEMFGPRAEHLGHLLAWAHQAGLTIGQMLEMPFYHPVIEEGLRSALRDVATKIGNTVARAA